MQSAFYSTYNNDVNSHNYYNVRISNKDDQIFYQASSLIWDYDHNVLPISLRKFFTGSHDIHNHNSRGASLGSLYCAEVNTVKYGIKSFKYRGVRVLSY